MARLLAGLDFLDIITYCQDNEQIGMNVFHFFVQNSPTPTMTDLDLAGYLSPIFAPLYKALMSPNSSYLGTSVRVFDATPLPNSQHSTDGAGNGTVGTVALPRQTAGIISWKTTLAGQRNRGRSYLPFPADDFNQADGIPTAGYVTAAEALIALMVLPIEAEVAGRVATITFSLYHRDTDAMTPIVNGTVPQRWATQKRRGSYGRPNSSPF